ncbi:OadG family protein [Agarilytica rhodophyticola]|uniref:OadG family protein n=1 Tax=Agarilytica rhodophyticola TaxID=1737490 RepID=UPI000B343EBE|nr:OadG family protein [Agarilytica rhodophyticola]
MQSSLFQQGVDLMLFGMGTVFVFLTLLVISVTLMSKIIANYFAEQEPEPVAKAPSSANTPAAVDPVILAVIQDAIHQHRAKNQP